MKVSRREINKIILEELEAAVESGEITEQQLQELLPGLKALGKAAWGGVKKAAGKVRDIYKSGEEAAKAQKAGQQQAGAQQQAGVNTQETPPAGQQQQQPGVDTPPTPAAGQQQKQQAAPKLINVEKGKNSLQNQLMAKYGGQLGPKANSALSLIARNIKAELSANGIQVQESERLIHGYLLKELVSLNEGKLEDDYQEASMEQSAAEQELKRLNRDVDTRDLMNYQGGKVGYDRDLRQAQNAIETAKQKKAELKKQIDSQPAQQQEPVSSTTQTTPPAQGTQTSTAGPGETSQSVAAGPAAGASTSTDQQKPDVKKPVQPQQAKPTQQQTKHVPKAGQVNIARVVNDGLKQAVGDINDPKNQAVLKTLSPQIINLVTKFVNYAVNNSGKQGQIKVIGMGYGKQPQAKPTAAKPAAKLAAQAPQQAAAPVQESYKAIYNKWQKIIKG